MSLPYYVRGRSERLEIIALAFSRFGLSMCVFASVPLTLFSVSSAHKHRHACFDLLTCLTSHWREFDQKTVAVNCVCWSTLTLWAYGELAPRCWTKLREESMAQWCAKEALPTAERVWGFPASVIEQFHLSQQWMWYRLFWTRLCLLY